MEVSFNTYTVDLVEAIHVELPNKARKLENMFEPKKKTEDLSRKKSDVIVLEM